MNASELTEYCKSRPQLDAFCRLGLSSEEFQFELDQPMAECMANLGMCTILNTHKSTAAFLVQSRTVCDVQWLPLAREVQQLYPSS
jgi:hypothetical protein